MTIDDLYRVAPPWVVVCPAAEKEDRWKADYLYDTERRNAVIRALRGKRMRSRAGLMQEFAAAFQFFEGFGENYQALKECLCYLDEELPADGYVVSITKCEKLLVESEPEELKWLIRTLHEVGEFWARPIVDNDAFNRPARPFHSVLTCRPEGIAEFKERILTAGADVTFLDRAIHREGLV